jgi:alpha-tubulin suppressor-like RCC1 family protein
LGFRIIVNVLGKNDYGALGLSSFDNKKPVNEPTLNKFFSKNKLRVVDVVCDGNHTIAITKSGKSFSFGNGKYENFSIFGSLFARTLCLGHEKSENINRPKLIKGLKDNKIRKISSNKHATLFLDEDNNVYVCGRGEWGVNGMGNSKSYQTPVLNTLIDGIIKSIDDPKILKLVGCSDFSSILLSNGDVFSFGNNDQGIMGLEKSMGVDMTESIAMPQPMYREKMIVNDSPGFIKDIELGERISIMKVAPEGDKDHKGVIFWGGLKLSSLPQIVDYDFSEDYPKLISASDRGWAFTTKSNK